MTAPTAADAELLFRNFVERMQTKYGPDDELAALKIVEEAKKRENEASPKL